MQQLNGEQSRFVGFAQLMKLLAVLVILIALGRQSYEAMNEIRRNSDGYPNQTGDILSDPTFDAFRLPSFDDHEIPVEFRCDLHRQMSQRSNAIVLQFDVI